MRELISLLAYYLERQRLKQRRLERFTSQPPPEEPLEEARCLHCGADLSQAELYRIYRVCDVCHFHHYLPAWKRVNLLVDPESFQELDPRLATPEFLQLESNLPYQERLLEAQRKSGLAEAVLTGSCSIGGNSVVLAVLDFGFMGGSLGVVAGEKLARAFEFASRRRLPLVVVISSSGCRVEEGVLSLIQMGKVTAAARRFQEDKLSLICILSSPTTGEVYVSLASLGDIIIAEPQALLGFAPLRVMKEEAGGVLPEKGHTAEAHLEHGLIDQVAERTEQRHLLSIILDLLTPRYRLGMRKKAKPYFAPLHAQEQPWQTVQLARHKLRPTFLDYMSRIAFNFVELHGDRVSGDDPALICGLAEIGGEAVVVIGQQRDRNEGRVRPEGFRKAQRAMKLAAKFNLPLINFIDTPGAYPGPEAEEKGIGQAIASTMAFLSDLPTPVISVIIGQGGSEGALALSLADRVLMLENAYLTVISPERAASIFYRDATKAQELAPELRLTAAECKEFGIIDLIVPEPEGGAHANHAEASRLLRNLLLQELAQIQVFSPSRLAKSRYHRLRYLGETGLGPLKYLRQQAEKFRELFQSGAQLFKEHLGPG